MYAPDQTLRLAFYLILAALLMAASANDIRTRRIPNKLTYPAMLVLVSLHGIAGGAEGFLCGLGGLGLGLALMLPAYLMGKMGAGDVKLMAAAGAGLGPEGTFTAFLLICLAGGLQALLSLAGNSRFFARTMGTLWTAGIVWVSTGDPGAFAVGNPTAAGLRLCYGVSIAAGSMAAMAWKLSGHDFLKLY